MKNKELQDLLEATRQKIAAQGRVVDSRLLSKEIMLEKVLSEETQKQVPVPVPVTLQQLLTD